MRLPVEGRELPLTLVEYQDDLRNFGAKPGTGSVGGPYHIYRAGNAPEVLDNPDEVVGDPILRGFRLDVRKFWNALEMKGR